MIYGVTGSGKTTFAAKLSERTGIPWHSVDDLTHGANWVDIEVEEQRRRISAICEGPEWILDSAYAKWLDVPMASVQLIIALDYPRVVSFTRLMRRTLKRIVDQKPVCNGNRESLRQALSRNSILLWHFKSFKRKRARMRGWLKEVEGVRVLRFAQPREAEKWLKTVHGQLRTDQLPSRTGRA